MAGSAPGHQVASGTTICEYVEGWIVEVVDYTPRVARIYHLLQSGQAEKAKRLLPPERVYPVNPEVGKRIRIDG